MISGSTRVVLAAGTVGGAGTTVALAAAAKGLTEVDGLIVAPQGYPTDALAGTPSVGRGRVLALLTEAIGLPRGDVYIGFADRLPLVGRAGRTQVMVVQNPHLYDPDSTWATEHPWKHRLLRFWARHSVRKADLIVCSTETSRESVLDQTEALADRVVVRSIPAPAGDVVKTDHRQQIERVLVVGDIYDYKRIECAIDATDRFAVAVDRDVELIHLGRAIEPAAGAAVDDAVARARRARVERRGSVPHGEVLAAMADADVLLLTSATESQGLPLAEALAVGLPVICRHIPVFAEQGTPAAKLVDGGSDEIGAFTEALGQLDDQDERRRRAEVGRDRAVRSGAWDLLPEH